MTLPTPEEVVREMTRPIDLDGDNFAWQRRAERIIAERDAEQRRTAALEALEDARRFIIRVRHRPIDKAMVAADLDELIGRASSALDHSGCKKVVFSRPSVGPVQYGCEVHGYWWPCEEGACDECHGIDDHFTDCATLDDQEGKS